MSRGSPQDVSGNSRSQCEREGKSGKFIFRLDSVIYARLSRFLPGKGATPHSQCFAAGDLLGDERLIEQKD
jgi:hypothetical protein